MRKTTSPRGQSLVLVALLMAGLVAVAALLIDGGNIYLNRRQAQTAADAAAMAGAHEMCVQKGDLAAITSVANQYATVENQASSLDSVKIEDGAVVVSVTKSTRSYFAPIFGQDSNIARARASAGCFPPATFTRVLPIAWTCRQPVGGSSSTCSIHSIPWPIFQTLLGIVDFNNTVLTEGDEIHYTTYTDNPPGEGKLVYLVMDSDKFDPSVDCQELNPAGQINCDFNDDGILDVEGGANRGWLLLDGGTGAHDLSEVMLNGYPDPITIPHWFAGKNGVSNSVFINAHQIRFMISLLPVFNAVCTDTTSTDLPSECSTEYKAGDLITGSSGNGTYYRVAAFAPFVVTCVSKGASEKCPGKKLSNIDKNTSTIEGYFVSGYVAGTDISPSGFDLGVYIISLTQ